jgi:hypothetical protein
MSITDLFSCLLLVFMHFSFFLCRGCSMAAVKPSSGVSLLFLFVQHTHHTSFSFCLCRPLPLLPFIIFLFFFLYVCFLFPVSVVKKGVGEGVPCVSPHLFSFLLSYATWSLPVGVCVGVCTPMYPSSTAFSFLFGFPCVCACVGAHISRQLLTHIK